MDEISLNIDKLAFGGSGIGRHEGKVCFVPFSCPGDQVTVRFTAEKRSFSTGSIVDIVVPSPHRVSPVCSLFGKCGGCNWQHIEYSSQLAAKREIFIDTLWRGARVDGGLVEDVVPSPQQYGYRSRVQFKLHVSNGRIQIGFFRPGSHYVEDAPQGCPIAMPVINEVLQRLRAVLESFPEPDMISQVNIDCSEQGVVAIVSYSGKDSEMAFAFFESKRSELVLLTGLYLQAGRKTTLRKVYGDDLLAYSLPDHNGKPCLLTFRPGGFSQVNVAQNRTLLDLVRRLAGFKGNEKLLDLYCGNGNFSLPLASQVSAVTGVEEYADSIAAAIENSAGNGILNADFICADAAAGVKQMISEGRHFDVVILDPPRSGAADLIALIAELKPEKIIYISCDPVTLARDCGMIAKTGLYSVKTTVPVDMFPQTYHLESVTLIQRG